jgi:hypothetical protein
MGAEGTLGKLTWPARDQTRGVDGSELGDLGLGGISDRLLGTVSVCLWLLSSESVPGLT